MKIVETIKKERVKKKVEKLSAKLLHKQKLLISSHCDDKITSEQLSKGAFAFKRNKYGDKELEYNYGGFSVKSELSVGGGGNGKSVVKVADVELLEIRMNSVLETSHISGKIWTNDTYIIELSSALICLLDMLTKETEKLLCINNIKDKENEKLKSFLNK